MICATKQATKQAEFRAPFPWFGGKSRVAGAVWNLLGQDCAGYIEPHRIGAAADSDGLSLGSWLLKTAADKLRCPKLFIRPRMGRPRRARKEEVGT